MTRHTFTAILVVPFAIASCGAPRASRSASSQARAPVFTPAEGVRNFESLNEQCLAAQPQNPSCYEEMVRRVALYLERDCKNVRNSEDAGACLKLWHMDKNLHRVPEVDMMPHEITPAERVKLYTAGGEEQLQLSKACCDRALRFRSTPKKERCDEIAFNAGRAFLAANLRAKAEEALEILKDPANGLQATDSAFMLEKAIAKYSSP